ncbi:sir2 family domain-containing protein [Ditylenchus destructor]|uniref:Sir2 family domain-containing protein n=1 Tax=Ditylenchus destructor TaxID=166010 RepID=A0AAD4NAP3_9BILA|nr:sir2 family domain-containing protein [Ditylenchus destructor]
MADKEDLIPSSKPTSKSEDPSEVTVTKEETTVEVQLSPTSSESVQITSTSVEVSQSRDTSKKPEKQKSEEAKDSKHDEDTSSATPTLFEKFVRSFDSVLHDLSAEPKVKQKLPSLDIEGVAAYINEENPKNIIFMIGAGVSTSAGIPDFRSPGTGLYDNLQKFDLPDPQSIFDISFFKVRPEPFFTFARDFFIEDVKPTPCHHFIRLMEQKGLLRRCFTQNIDALEYAAGVNPDKIVTAHGSYLTSTCQKSSCKKKYNKEWFVDFIRQKEVTVPRCTACNGVVKPDIVFFGESLPSRFFTTALTDFPKCDLLVIMGTSLVVQPFASLVQQVPSDTPRLLINLTPVGKDMGFFSDKVMSYDEPNNIRDVFWKGTCDDGAIKLARLLGWEQELTAMVKESKDEVKV